MGIKSFLRNPITKGGNAIRNVRRLGLLGALDLYSYRLREKYRDWRLGIRSSGFHDANDLGHVPECHAYEPIDYRCLDIIFGHLEPDAEADVFLDYGCGKGRAVITAATHPFKRVLGVELSSELSDLGRSNISRAMRKQRLQCTEIEIITANATEYEVPDDVTVIFFFNPFSGSVLAAVQGQIRQSLQRAPRRLRVIYMHPDNHPNEFESCDWLEKPFSLPIGDWEKVQLLAYESRVVADALQDDVLAGAIES